MCPYYVGLKPFLSCQISICKCDKYSKDKDMENFKFMHPYIDQTKMTCIGLQRNCKSGCLHSEYLSRINGKKYIMSNQISFAWSKSCYIDSSTSNFSVSEKIAPILPQAVEICLKNFHFHSIFQLESKDHLVLIWIHIGWKLGLLKLFQS